MMAVIFMPSETIRGYSFRTRKDQGMKDISLLTAIVSVLTGLSGAALGWAGRARAARQDVVQETKAEVLQQADVEYIKRGVDDMKVEQKLQRQQFEAFSERLTRVEESAKQAHKRIDRIEEGRG